MRPLASIALAVLLCGCTPSPDQVCRKLIDMQGGWFANDKERAEGLKLCIDEKTKHKQEHPERYKCEADCVMGERNLVAAADCNAKCK
jgi:hypothetical protein